MDIPTLTLRYTFWLLQAKLRTDVQILFTFVLLIIHITLLDSVLCMTQISIVTIFGLSLNTYNFVHKISCDAHSNFRNVQNIPRQVLQIILIDSLTRMPSTTKHQKTYSAVIYIV